MKTPSAAEYNLINQWTPSPSKREPPIGTLKVLERTTKSARGFSVYN